MAVGDPFAGSGFKSLDMDGFLGVNSEHPTPTSRRPALCDLGPLPDLRESVRYFP